MLRERIARALFEHEAATYEPEPVMIDLAWIDPDIRRFWLERADVVIGVLNVTTVPPAETAPGHNNPISERI